MLDVFFEKIREKKKLLMLVFGVLFLLIFFVIVSSLFLKKSESPEVSNFDGNNNIGIKKNYNHNSFQEEDCDEMKGIQRDICNENIFLKEAVFSKNVKNCLNIKNIDKRNECLLNIISNTMENSEWCYKILNFDKRLTCLDRIAVSSSNIKICDMNFEGSPFEIQKCIDRVMTFKISNSGEKDDIKQCSEIKSMEYPSLCYINSFKNKFNNNCNEVPSELKDLCDSLFIANNGDNIKKCDLIKIKEYQDYCYIRFKEGKGDVSGILELDSDGDGIKEGDELFYHTNMHNPDTDGDGINDGDEVYIYYTNPKNADTDYDSLNDHEEIFVYKTNPNKTDTDNDGISDGDEIKAGTNPHTGDTDKDGLLDIDEKKFGTDINNSDTDGDGMSDLEETRSGFDPLKSGQELADTDGDGLIDIDEIFYGTDRFNSDTDGDGISDEIEVDNLTNPFGEGDMDFDGDGISDKEEEKNGTNPSLDDSDGDGLTDYEEIFEYKTNPSKKDTDRDGYSDGQEVKNGYNPLGKGKLKQ